MTNALGHDCDLWRVTIGDTGHSHGDIRLRGRRGQACIVAVALHSVHRASYDLEPVQIQRMPLPGQIGGCR